MKIKSKEELEFDQRFEEITRTYNPDLPKPTHIAPKNDSKYSGVRKILWEFIIPKEFYGQFLMELKNEELSIYAFYELFMTELAHKNPELLNFIRKYSDVYRGKPISKAALERRNKRLNSTSETDSWNRGEKVATRLESLEILSEEEKKSLFDEVEQLFFENIDEIE